MMTPCVQPDKNHLWHWLFVLGLMLSLLCLPLSAKQLSSEQIDEILYHIHTYYVEDLPLSHVKKDNFSELLTQLDDYSKFLDEHELEALFSAANGRYTGLGIEVEEVEDGVVIVDTLPGSPAEAAGIEGGDKLLAINTHDVKRKSIAEVSKLLREAQFSTIQLTVERANTEVTLALRRQEITLRSVSSQLLPGGIGYVLLSSFNNHSYHDIARHISMLNSHLGAPLKGLIIDLRDNPGGTLNSAVAISDLFLQSGTIVSTRGRFYDANQRFFAAQGDILNGAPMLVLINEQSASAAEILAGALQDNSRALILGNRSYGKGSVQSLIPIGNGTTALKLTTARYFTPSGQSIEGTGIQPDVIFSKQVLLELDKDAIMAGEKKVRLTFVANLDKHWQEAEQLLQNHNLQQ
ncbi:S41 family peptidase [Pseudoalteromonas ardens]|uniref:Peptidase S41 n=1 Tax=Pseudoalteromonas rubra TaxID=43658 RepID=A0A0L0EZ86_9GAMM|nr:S41 family peptidase [Pseudoalteromonas sp. R96]KNC69133.1 peptidase S41 [Pseudoalteromonas rubra]MDK1312679.1 S41 family peptidase [Pseudoalteromonas sp. R96]